MDENQLLNSKNNLRLLKVQLTLSFQPCSLVHIKFCFVFYADMVKNKGFLPSGPSEISIQRNQIKDIIHSLLPACQDPDPATNITFKADAIIANPPAYG